MASALALALALAAPSEAPVALDDLIVFSDRSRCEPAAPFRRILDQLWEERSGRTDFLKAVPRTYRPAFGFIQTMIGNNGAADIWVETRASWHGLKLSRIALATRYGEPGIKLELVIDASGQRTLDTLHPLGWKFGALSERPQPRLEFYVHEPIITILSCTLPYG